MGQRKRIALIAHDNCKLVSAHGGRPFASDWRVIAHWRGRGLRLAGTPAMLVLAAVWAAMSACTAQSVDGRSRQRLGLRLTGLGKTASVELPVERRNTRVTRSAST